MLVDSHCHLDCLDLNMHENSMDKVLQTAEESDVKHFLCVNIDLDHFPNVLAIAKQYPNVDASVGLHPNDTIDIEPNTEDLIALALDPNIVAIGETGLDYYRSTGDLDWQRERFRTHIRAALAIKKPLIIHMREANEDTLKILHEENAAQIGGVMHCFSADTDIALQAIDLGFYISFAGNVTFKNAKNIQAACQAIPLSKMLLETDCPYLTPMPYRGRPNQPAYVRFTAEFIAKLRNEALENIASATTQNYFDLFHTNKES